MIAIFMLQFSIFNSPTFADPTLARLAFWAPPQRIAEFESAYKTKVVPILKQHGLVESSERGRATPDSIFSRLFELKTPSEVEEKQKALRGDSIWTTTLRGLGSAFGTTQSDSLIQFSFTIYAVPAGSGKVVPAGPGKTLPAGRGTGHWRTYDVTDGLAGADVSSIFQDREGNLWFGTVSGVSRYDGQIFTTFTTQEGLAHNDVRSIFQDREGNLWFGTVGGASRYDPSAGSVGAGQKFTTFTTEDGLAGNWVNSIFQDREGNIWFGIEGGVSRYNGKTFTTFTTRDGLVHNDLGSMLQDREGSLWFGTTGSGVSRYDGKTFTTFTTQDGLAHNWVYSIFQDRERSLWFGTTGSGVSRYDGKTFTTFTTQDGLAGNSVFSIFQDREGNLWFGTSSRGVSRYNGQTFITFTIQDGLAGNSVFSIFQDREGVLWFGTNGGVSRYDGQAWMRFTPADGLAGIGVYSIFQDREGNFWFGTGGSGTNGVSRYDGKTFTTFTAKDGLPNSMVLSIFQDREGSLWFGTRGGGASRYDGQVFQTMTRQDGLAGNWVISIFQDREGVLWFGTWGGGVTCYRTPAPSPPPIFIDAVVADRRYEKISEVAIPSSVKLTAFEFRAISFKTRPEAMVYRYRLKGYDKDWKNTHERRVEYQDLPRGSYTFEVMAVDRDLVYSEKPATVALRVHLPYDRMALLSALAVALGLVAWQTTRVVRRDRRLREANTALSSANKDLFGVNQDLQQTLKEKEEAQRQLIQVERMAAVGELVAGSAHELNNPLAATSSLVQSTQEMLEEDSPEEILQDRQAMVDNLKVSRRELNRARDIVSSLLSLSDRTRSYAEAVQINIVADDALRMLKGKYDEGKVRIVKAYGEDLPTVMGSFADLGQMGMHLVRNAIESLKGEGTVTLRTYGECKEQRSRGAEEQKRSSLSLAPLPLCPPAGSGGDVEWVVFECHDTGAGIPPEIRGEIFKPFFKTKPPAEGTGLGLYICREVVEKHGGTISVESAIGKGTTFSVRLPLTR